MCERGHGVLFISIESFLVLNGVLDPSKVGALLLEETCELAAKMLSETCRCVRPFRLLRDVARVANLLIYTDADYEADDPDAGRCLLLAKYLRPDLPVRIFTLSRMVEHVKRSAKLYFDHKEAEAGMNFHAWLAQLRAYLREWRITGDASGNRVAVACSSRAMVRRVCELAKETGCFWCDYTSDTGDDVKNVELADPATYWVEVGLVAFTQTLSVGVDPQSIQFAAVFIYAASFGCSIRCLLQGALRFGRDVNFKLVCSTVFICLCGRPQEGGVDLGTVHGYYEQAMDQLKAERAERLLAEQGIHNAVTRVARLDSNSQAGELHAYGGVLNTYTPPDDEELGIAAWSVAETIQQKVDPYSLLKAGLLRHGWVENGAALDAQAAAAFARLPSPESDSVVVALNEISIGKQISSLMDKEAQFDRALDQMRSSAFASVAAFFDHCEVLEEEAFHPANAKAMLRLWKLLRRLPTEISTTATGQEMVELQRKRDAIELHALGICVGSTQLFALEAVRRAEAKSQRSAERHSHRLVQAMRLQLFDELATLLMTNSSSASFFVAPGECSKLLGTAKPSVVRALEASRRKESDEFGEELLEQLRAFERKLGIHAECAELATTLRRVCREAYISVDLKTRQVQRADDVQEVDMSNDARRANLVRFGTSGGPVRKKPKREEQIVAVRFERKLYSYHNESISRTIERDYALNWTVESPHRPGLFASSNDWRAAHGVQQIIVPSELRRAVEEDLGICEAAPPRPGEGPNEDRPQGNARSSGTLGRVDAVVAEGLPPPESLLGLEWVPSSALEDKQWCYSNLHEFCSMQVGALQLQGASSPTLDMEAQSQAKSAFVILTRNIANGTREVLLARERRQRGEWLNFIGGKQEAGEATRQTAVREMDEETCGLLSSTAKAELATDALRFVLWHEPTKADLFSFELSDPADVQLSERVNAAVAAHARARAVSTYTPPPKPPSTRKSYRRIDDLVPRQRVIELIALVSAQLASTRDPVFKEKLQRGRAVLQRYESAVRAMAVDEYGICWKATSYSRQMALGRLTAVKPSMQPMPNLFRQWLYRGLLHDIDIVNAHPTILLGLVKQLRPHSWEANASTLVQYVADRKGFLDKIMLWYGLPARGFAKIALLVVLNGGELKYWRKKVKSPVASDKPDLPELVQLQCEALWIRDTLVFQESAFAPMIASLRASIAKLSRNAGKSDDEISRSAFAYVLGHLESMALDAAYVALERHGFRVTCIIYDGCLVTHNPDGDLSAAMEDAKVEMEKALGFPGLRVVEKPMFNLAPFDISAASLAASDASTLPQGDHQLAHA